MRIHQRSFGGGIIAPEMLGRIDLNHYQTGLAESLNGYPLPHGPWVNRPGFQFVKECKNGGSTAVRTIPFIFNTDQAYALEVGNLYIRIHTEASTVLESTSTISGATRANPCVVTDTGHGYSNGDEVYISSIVGMTELNGRYFKVANKNTNDYELTDLQDNNINSSAYTAYSSAGTSAKVYEVVTPFATADLFDINFTQSADVMTLVHPNHAPRELRRSGAASWALATITFAPTIGAPAGVSVSASPSSGSLVYKYVVTALSETLEESVASSEVTASSQDLSIAANKNTVTWSAVTDATRYNIYKDDNGVHGFIGQTPDTTFVDDNIEADVLVSPPENLTPFTSTNNYPSTASYHDQRRVFAATNNSPQSTWMTRPGTESNLSKSIPSQDDDSVLFTLAARQYNRIRSLIPLDELIIFTSATEWKLATENSDALTPTTISLRPQSYIGSSNLSPIVSGDAVLFVADLGGHVYDMNYSFETDKYKPRDISIIAPHLFDGYTIVDWDYASVPTPLIWAIRSDGRLVGLTYLSGQKPDVLGWHQHTTAGDFESVCVIPETGGEKFTYVVILRRINDVNRRFIERMHSRLFTEIQDAFFVDSGLSYDNPKTITAATKASPVVVTSASHGFSNDDVIQITEVAGLGKDLGMTELNGNRYTVKNKTTNTIELYDVDEATPAVVNGSAYKTYVRGGVVRKEITTVSGLHHLIGESVAIFADGSVVASQTVAADGSITLSQGAARIHAGLSYTSDMRTLPIVIAKGDGLGQGQVKSVPKVWMRVDKTRALQAGPDFDHLRALAFRTSEAYGVPTALKTDEIEINLDPNWNRSGQIAVRQEDPAPLTILSATLEVEIGAA
jgi:hypothetical protein